MGSIFPLIALLISLVPAIAYAQAFPGKPVRIIVSFPAGSGVDASTRFIAARLGPLLGQPVVVENRPGASGILGTEAAAKAPADGYTLFMAPPTAIILPHLYSRVPYNVDRDFEAVSLIGISQTGVMVHPSVAARDLVELVALSKKDPLNVATAGVGSNHHLYGAWFALLTGAKFSFVAYATAAPLGDLVAGHTQVMFDGLGAGVGLFNSGKLRLLAITGKSRHPQFPSVPTYAELNLPEFEPLAWSGILAPAGTPGSVVNQLSTAAATAARSAEVVERYRRVGGEAVGSTPAEFTAFLKAEGAKWARVIKALNIRLEQ